MNDRAGSGGTTPSNERQPHVHMFWNGPRPTLYEDLSFRSFLAAGARVSLYTYNKNLPVPDGVELVDANEILPAPGYSMVHASGERSLVSPSNLFRYTAIGKLGGWYADADIVCLAGTLPDVETYLARETNWSINAAIMKFPAHHPVVETLLDECVRIQTALENGSIKESWGVLGPALVTRVVTSMGFSESVLPRSRAYEIGYDEVLELFDPASCEELAERTQQSDFIHLWNEVWRSLKIPKLFGPPAGSFLDSLFRRFDVDVPGDARLSLEAARQLFRERQLITDVKYNLRTETLPANATEKFIRWANGTGHLPEGEVVRPEKKAHPIAKRPQLVQTFWHGGEIAPFQLLCLRSFVDHGHQVEVFTYEDDLKHPEWLTWSNASDIVPRDRILVQAGSQIEIRSDLFKFALLNQRGGWWIDPDVLLAGPDLPDAEIFHAGTGDFELVSTAALKFPKQHPFVEAALKEISADNFRADDRAGERLLTRIIWRGRLEKDLLAMPPLSRLSWFGIADLFDPEKVSDLERDTKGSQFLHLHMDAWRRAGIPQRIGPPEGSLLDYLFRKHDTGVVFPARAEFADVRRWILHMYGAIRNSG
ncbi:MAG: hypothetical protein AB1342_15350 [Pseudomonadota bacterium]